jgi:hypothetical protein
MKSIRSGLISTCSIESRKASTPSANVTAPIYTSSRALSTRRLSMAVSSPVLR